MSEDLYPFDGNPDLKKQERQDKAAAHEDKEDIEFLLSTDNGLRFVRNLINESGVFDETFVGSSKVYFNQGVRSVGLRILRKVKMYAPEKLHELIVFKEPKPDQFGE